MLWWHLILAYLYLRFESSVISYGSETTTVWWTKRWMFESSVISYGSETTPKAVSATAWFESSVISYGSETEG